MKRSSILLLSCVIALYASSALLSQSAPAPDAPKTTEAQPEAKPADEKPASEVVQPGTDANRTTPAVQGSNAEKAKTYFDGATTFVNSKVLFRLTTRDNFVADKITYKIDGGADQTYDKEFAITEEGKHTITYFGTDKIGNREDDKISHITVDNTAPEVAVSPKYPFFTANGKTFVSKQYSFNVSAVDMLSGVNRILYTVNGKDYTDYATAFSIYADGDITFGVKAEDNVGNTSAKFRIKKDDGTVEEKESLALYVDNIVPTVTITSDKPLVPVNGKNIASKEYTYTVAGADKESGIKAILARVDGKGDFIPYDKPVFFTTNGDHYIEAKAVDGVGNVSDTVILAVYVDLIPPKSNIDTLAD